MTIWFTADLHINHPFMTTDRGFSYMAAHDRAIIEGWNSVVKGGDCVVVCGDVFWTWDKERQKIWNKVLKGSKVMVKGNHDRWLKQSKFPYKRIYSKTYTLNKKHRQHVVCCHYPMRSWNRKIHGAIHVHGHCHASILPHWRMLDVGVDAAKIILGGWRPFSLEEIIYLTTYKKDKQHEYS